ncbi:MAG: TonB-dependent receptor [Myxococcota bacterium]
MTGSTLECASARSARRADRRARRARRSGRGRATGRRRRVSGLVLALLAAPLAVVAGRSVRAEEAPVRRTWDVDEEVVVTATRVRDVQAEQPFQASLLEGDALDLGLSPTVADALRFVPGLHLVQEGAAGGRAALSLRGLDPNHVVVLVDGVRVNDPTNTRGGSFDPSTLALVDLERVEIVRGPLSAIHGADAMAGVIQIVTRGVEPDDALHSRVRARIGRFHTAQVAARASAGVGGVAGLSLGAGLDGSRDPHSDGGFDAASFHAKLRVPLPGRFGFEGFTRIHASSARAFPESSGGPELAVLRAMEDRDVREILVGALLARPVLGRAPGIRVQVSRASRREDLESPGISSGALPGNVADIVPASRAGDEYERWEFSLVGEGELPAFGGPVFAAGTRLVAGFTGVWEDGESDTALAIPGVGSVPAPFYDTRRTRSVFGELAQPLGPAVLSASLRFDGTPDEQDRLSPAVGFASPIPGTPFSVYGRYAEGFRRPSFYALRNPIVGNAELGLELGSGWEAGLRYRGLEDRLTVQLGYFDLEVENLHDFDAESFTIVERGRLVSRGVELEVALRPRPFLELLGALSFNPTDFGGTSLAPLNRPRWRGFAEIRASPFADWAFGLRVLGVGSSKATAAAIDGRTITLAGYERVDLRTAWTPIDGVELFFEIENLTDRDHREAVGFESPGIAPRIGVVLTR